MLFLAFLMACGRRGHIFAKRANPRSCIKKVAMSTLLHCSRGEEYETEMCNIPIESMAQAAFTCEGQNFRQVVSTTRLNHQKQDRPSLEPKTTKIQSTLETRQEMYRPNLVPLPWPLLFPLLGLLLKVRTGSYQYTCTVPTIRRVMDLIKTFKRQGSTLTTEIGSAAKFHSIFLSQTVKCCKRLV